MSAAPIPPVVPLTVATCNLLDLALPGRLLYPALPAYGRDEYDRKIAWLGAQFARLDADVMGVQEVWDEAALREAVARSGLAMAIVAAPGAEHGARATPCVGVVSRWPVERIETFAEFLPGEVVDVPELGPRRRFERAPLHARVRTPNGVVLNLLVVHLKSQRPKFLQDAVGAALEDRDDPAIVARATLRSLLMRAAEAVALRRVVAEITGGTGEPLVLVGDMNDGPQAVTTQIFAATRAGGAEGSAPGVTLRHAAEVQAEPALRRDLWYSHVNRGWPDLFDQIWVSEAFVPGSGTAIGDVQRIEIFNDHLHQGRDRSRSDHGFVRALLRLQGPGPQGGTPRA